MRTEKYNYGPAGTCVNFELKNKIASRDDISVETIEKKWPQDFVQAYKTKISELIMV